VHGSANVVHYGMVHRLVDDDHRTTVISANSLGSRLGSIAGTAGLGALATVAGIPVALAVGAAVLAAAAPLYWVAGRQPRRPSVPTSGGECLDRLDGRLPAGAA
jgi:predicted MFS family arabinose efflux permease